MNLRSFFLLLQVPFLALLLVFGVLLSRAVVANAQATQYAAQTRLEVGELSDLLGLVLNMETGMRGFVITGAEPFVEPYRTARAQWPQALQVLRDQAAQFEGPERAAREAHLSRLSALMDRWQNEVAEPELKLRLVSKEQAEAVVASGRGKVLIDQIRTELAAYEQTAEQSLVSREARAEQNFRVLQNTLLTAGLAVLLGAAAAAWWGAGWLSKQFGAVGRAARWLSQGQAAELPASSLTEQRQLARAFNAMSGQLTQAQLQARVRTAELEQQGQMLRQLGQLGDLMLAAQSLEEGGQIAGRALPHLLPDSAGTLFIYAASRNLLYPLTQWGGAEEKPRVPDHCWALRRGEALWPEQRAFVPPCLGTQPAEASPYACLPLNAHGEALGLLQVRLASASASATDGAASSAATERQILAGLTRQLSLSLHALRLQDQLRQQSIRDALTGLYNRRYYEDHLAASVARLESSEGPLSLLALDVDHFKRFNDTFGHDAGDAVLRKVGAALAEAAQHTGEAACRPGGEEFALILPNVTVEAALRRAEAIRAEIESWSLTHAGVSLGQVTVSIGIASLPPGRQTSWEAVARQADEALYAAKEAGRNRVFLSPQSSQTG